MDDKNNRTLGFVIVSKDNDGLRHDRWSGESYIERLDVSGAKTDRLITFFKDHDRSVDSAVGRVHDIRVERGELKCNVSIGSDSNTILNKYKEQILTDVSIGYAIRDFEVEERDGEPDIVTVTDYAIYELSCVGIGFDRGAKLERYSEDRSMDITAEQLRELSERLDRVSQILKK